MTKKEIKAKLLSYGIEVTLRPRKATLLELLERVEKEHKAGRLTSKVTHMDDIYYACCDTEGNIYQDPPIEKVMEWLTLVGCTVFFGFLLLGVINFYTDIAIPASCRIISNVYNDIWNSIICLVSREKVQLKFYIRSGMIWKGSKRYG